MARIDTLEHFVTDVADAIRTKTGSSDPILVADFDTEIENIPSGGEFNATIDVTKRFTSNISSIITKIDTIDTSNMTSLWQFFSNCQSLTTIPLLDTSKVTNMSYMFSSCTSLTTIPLIDTSKVTNMSYMFQNCPSLTLIPALDTSSVTNMDGMFSFNSFTDECLNNILQMCINATSYNKTKSLSQLGLNESRASASRIQALSNYQDFLDAGWTIGY